MFKSMLNAPTEFYDKWNVQTFVLLSLSLQAILILFAPFRKRTGNGKVVFLIWVAYLLADWAANFAVGLISNSQKDIRQRISRQPDDHADILAFWAPFLLLHLGGPDTITAFALEDNALWLRHLVGLISQVAAAFLVFGQSFPKNKLWVSTFLLFVAGIIKYAERTRALFLANLAKFRKMKLKDPDPGPNYAKLMEEYSSKKNDAKLPAQIELIPEPNKESRTKGYVVGEGKLDDDLSVVKHAYHFYRQGCATPALRQPVPVQPTGTVQHPKFSQTARGSPTVQAVPGICADDPFKILGYFPNNFYEIFNGLIVDLIFSFRERDESRLFFKNRTPEDALKVLAVELNFIYEVLYTKVAMVHLGLGYSIRFVSWCVVVAALSTFYSIDKNGFHKTDVGITQGCPRITYTLLFGAIALDTIALFMLAFSDWTAASIQKLSRGNIWKASIDRCFLPLLKYFLTLKKINWWKEGESTSWLGRAREILFRRWSESLSQYNLIHYSLKERPKRNATLLFDCFGRTWIGLIKRMDLKDWYDQMKYETKKRFTEDLWKFIFEQLKNKSELGDDPDTAKKIWSARGEWVLQNTEWTIESSSKLMQYILDVDYDQSLILWHIATDLCYHTENINIHDDQRDGDSNNRREICKMLSDYMLYLLIMQPTMMSAVAGIGEIRFRDTCAEAKEFFTRKNIPAKEEHEQACERILDVNTDVRPVDLKGDRSKSVLFDACILAKELQNLKAPNKWYVMSEVWVELLSYAASHCRANTHAALLSKGGELITFVWLLMAHFGIGDQFQINEGHARAKLNVGK
ncbi:uncharacterized protein LOC133868884 [Alnus glutinosa]|uniref:uncharacterized protein LOC133868884 n=1 Tax=Alnus glutinosa TaxID=3517 RepID=UPI002D7722F2|nr:uncharacterized protein LOC133868884 [Alnus glutinosa]